MAGEAPADMPTPRTPREQAEFDRSGTIDGKPVHRAAPAPPQRTSPCNGAPAICGSRPSSTATAPSAECRCILSRQCA